AEFDPDRPSTSGQGNDGRLPRDPRVIGVAVLEDQVHYRVVDDLLFIDDIFGEVPGDHPESIDDAVEGRAGGDPFQGARVAEPVRSYDSPRVVVGRNGHRATVSSSRRQSLSGGRFETQP